MKKSINDGDTPIGVVGMDVDFDLMLNVVESLDIYILTATMNSLN